MLINQESHHVHRTSPGRPRKRGPGLKRDARFEDATATTVQPLQASRHKGRFPAVPPGEQSRHLLSLLEGEMAESDAQVAEISGSPNPEL